MDFTIKTGDPAKQRGACVVVGVFESRKLSPAAAAIDRASRGALGKILATGDMDGRTGQTLLLHHLPRVAAERVLLVGCGKQKDFDIGRLRQAMGTTAATLNTLGTRNAGVFLTELTVAGLDTPRKVRQAAEAASAAVYRFDELKTDPPKVRHPLRRLNLFVPDRKEVADARIAARQGGAIGQGVTLARDLGNLPGNICTPSYLADQARALAEDYPIRTKVLEEADMKRMGMGALLSVSRGSREPAKLITMEYKQGKRGDAPVVLVGKGLTFDAGGISLKPAASMDEMKFDMCGGASVFGVLKAIAEMELPINVVGVVPSSENLPDGEANKPGDIVTSMSGKTIEILNTDAEGRLILCDALTYAERFNPEVVIDIATLTGACVIALGAQASGLLGNNQDLVDKLIAAGEYSHDRAWQLPLWKDYQPQLDTNFADMANIGGREAGTITAACFLARFTEKMKWAHLDIAGTAWNQGKEKGGTGRPVPLLTQFLIERATQQ